MPLTSNYRIADEIFDSRDAGGSGLVTFVPGNIYVTAQSGSIQRAIDAASSGDTIHVESAVYAPYNTNGKNVSILFTVTITPGITGASFTVTGQGTFTGPVTLELAPGDYTVTDGALLGGGTFGFQVDALGNAISQNANAGQGGLGILNLLATTTIPATPTIIVSGGPFTYDRQPHAAIVTAAGIGGSSVSGSFVVTYNGSNKLPKKPGSYSVAVTFTSNDANYTNATGGGSITINPATPTITIDGGPFTYDGDSLAAKVKVKGLRGGNVRGNIDVTYNGSSVAPTDAGTYVVVVTFTSDNPKYADTVATGSITINPAAPKVKISEDTFTYDGQAHAPTVTVLGVRQDDGTGRPVVTGSVAITYNGSAVAPSNAGTYSVVVTFTSGDPNYSGAIATDTLTINQAKLTVKVDHALMLAGNDPPVFTGTVTGLIAGDDAVANYGTTATSQSAVGIYPIDATLSGTSAANYKLQVNQGNLYVVSMGTDPNASGGQAISFWDNAGNNVRITASDLKSLDKLDLLDSTGSNFDPTQAAQLQPWLQNASASNVAYWMSAQLAAMELNVLAGYVQKTDIVYAGQLVQYNTATNVILGLDSGGFITIGNLISAANAALATYGLGNSAYELALGNALFAANGYMSFVQQTVPSV